MNSKQEKKTEKCITFSVRRDFKANNEFRIDVGVHVHIPHHIVLWTFNGIHPIIIFTTTGMKLISARPKNLHVPHYYTTKGQVSNPIFVNITITHTVHMAKLNPSLSMSTEKSRIYITNSNIINWAKKNNIRTSKKQKKKNCTF